ncbi:hypothetical protein A9K55_004757 [Cordyceps militaris]|uniref:Uncharacterized protein n=1 Tax=Cordyceps militaris TaxID=73501 RepID=A0A2H4SLX3_CORMI|nr:hypothetical protein A9K55_004757 [Cordyceps militaris]
MGKRYTKKGRSARKGPSKPATMPLHEDVVIDNSPSANGAAPVGNAKSTDDDVMPVEESATIEQSTNASPGPSQQDSEKRSNSHMLTDLDHIDQQPRPTRSSSREVDSRGRDATARQQSPSQNRQRQQGQEESSRHEANSEQINPSDYHDPAIIKKGKKVADKQAADKQADDKQAVDKQAVDKQVAELQRKLADMERKLKYAESESNNLRQRLGWWQDCAKARGKQLLEKNRVITDQISEIDSLKLDRAVWRGVRAPEHHHHYFPDGQCRRLVFFPCGKSYEWVYFPNGECHHAMAFPDGRLYRWKYLHYSKWPHWSSSHPATKSKDRRATESKDRPATDAKDHPATDSRAHPATDSKDVLAEDHDNPPAGDMHTDASLPPAEQNYPWPLKERGRSTSM